MDQQTYHGPIKPDDLAHALVSEFNHGNLAAQKIGQGDQVLVQIATRERRGSGGHTALTVSLVQVEDGVTVSLGQQQWLGAAVNLAQAGLAALFNPLSLLHTLDDIAQDVSSLTLPQQIWAAVERYAQGVGAALTISERLRSVVCKYCGVANPVGVGTCSACGAPLGELLPVSCVNCGNVMRAKAKFCDNCGAKLST